MLQQTQVATVIPYYNAGSTAFRILRSLAQRDGFRCSARLARARLLHARAESACRREHRRHQAQTGSFPRTSNKSATLPGLGRYTANAVATFAFNQSVPIVEANIGRLLARLLDLQIPIDSTAGRERIWDLASDLVPKRDAAIYNSALMDLGALVCKARQPRCDICPVRKFCRATDPASLPLKKPRPQTIELEEHHGFAFQDGRVLLEQSRARWRGMWILPPLDSPNATQLAASPFPIPVHASSRRPFGFCPSRSDRPPGSRAALVPGSTCSLPSRCHHHIAAPSMPSWSNILFRLPTSRNVSASRQIRGASK